MDYEKLERAITESGVKKGHICEKLGLSRYGFYKKAKGQSEFTVSETLILQDLLRLTKAERDAIFFN